MRKCLLLLLTSFILFGANAQIRLAGVIGFHSANVAESNNLPGWDTATGKYYSSKTGIHVGVMGEFPLGHKGFYLQPGLNYSAKGRQFTKYNDSTNASLTDTVYTKNTLNLGYIEIPVYLTYKFALTPSGKTHLFIGAGPYFGFFYSGKMNEQSRTFSANKYSNTDEDLLVGNAENKYKTFDFGINARAGIEIGSVMLSGFYSRGISNFYTAPYNGTFHHQLGGVTLGIWLNKPEAQETKPVKVVKDSDNDGIDDEHDMCPFKPGTAARKGCPAPDTDKDGIDDDHDKCPMVAGSAKYQGCPVPDTDKDGIDDEHDSCINVPGIAKYHGCPIPDRDGDGVNDEEDKCPDIAGVKENNGCPAVKKEIADKVKYQAKNILFKTGSDKLTAGSYAALDDLAKTLKEHPSLLLTVEGHTDNTGTVEINLALSQKRADAVRNYLIQAGVAEDRLKAVGLGQEKPIADNNTESGRSANRRVELKLTSGQKQN